MPRPTDNENREQMEVRIMEAAKPIFCKKGFTNVTMTDLITAANMSRGGFYFYFKSVREVFQAVVTRRRISKFEEIRKSIDGNPDFYELLDSYFAQQKERLLNMETSLLRALYEFLFTHREESDQQFRKEQQNNILDTVNAILQLGVRQNVIPNNNIGQIAEHLMYTIEGLNAMALLQGLTEDTVDEQLALLKQMVINIEGNGTNE